MITKDIKYIWFVPEVKEQLPGAPVVFSDKAIEMCLQIRELMHLPLRQTEGFVEGLFESMNLNLSVPNYTLLGKRAKALNLKISRYHKRDKNLSSDN